MPQRLFKYFPIQIYWNCSDFKCSMDRQFFSENLQLMSLVSWRTITKNTTKNDCLHFFPLYFISLNSNAWLALYLWSFQAVTVMNVAAKSLSILRTWQSGQHLQIRQLFWCEVAQYCPANGPFSSIHSNSCPIRKCNQLLCSRARWKGVWQQ